jgi:drug/metabolite transporter (DMT)-like permease
VSTVLAIDRLAGMVVTGPVADKGPLHGVDSEGYGVATPRVTRLDVRCPLPMTGAMSAARSDAARVWFAMGVIYVVWGSTYLAIRIVVTDLPPLVTAGTRFLIAGAIVALALAIRSGPSHLRLGRLELAAAMLVGLALLLGGNGLVVLAEQTVPSGLTALIIGSTPLVLIVLRLIWRERIPTGTLIGTVVGFVGVACLIVPAWTGGGADAFGVALLVLAEISWASGSFISSRARMPADPFVSTAVQMLTGGAAMLVLGLLLGEPFEPATWLTAPDAFVAWLYLIFIGSLAGFTAYTWVLQHAPISRVATYAYVNPIVAVILGVVILNEVITPAMLLGGAIIVVAVALIIRNEALQQARADAAAGGRAMTVEEIG